MLALFFTFLFLSCWFLLFAKWKEGWLFSTADEANPGVDSLIGGLLVTACLLFASMAFNWW